VRLDGLDRKTHFKVTGTGTGPNPANADDIKVSPDGQRAFVNLQGKHYLVNVPIDRRPALTNQNQLM
jgi:hypothetical protein